MRRILLIIALFSIGTGVAQHPIHSFGKEQPRSETHIYPSADEATTAEPIDNRYTTSIKDWTRDGTRFTTSFTVPFAWINRQVLLHIDGASADYELFVNGKRTAYVANGNAPAEFNLTTAVKEGRNTLEIRLSDPAKIDILENWVRPSQPRVGRTWIMSQPTLRVRDVVTRTWLNKENPAQATAEVAFVMKSSALNPRTSRIHYELLSRTGERVAAGFKDVTIDMRHEDTVRFLAQIPASHLWSSTMPIQHTLLLRTQHEGRYLEYQEFRLGFRAIDLHDGHLSINGEPVRLHVKDISGTASFDEIDALREKGYNTMRLLPGNVSSELLDYCDNQGLYVIVTAPIDTRRSGTSRRRGGNPTNDPAWTEAYIERIAESYHTTKRHPSVVGFVIANKSANGFNLYESYLKIKEFNDIRPFIYPDAGGEWNSDKLITE